VHITSRVVPGLGSLRKRDMYLAIREATIAVILSFDPNSANGVQLESIR